MVSIPPILLKKLYVRGSLENREDTFTFQLQNQIATGTVVGLSRLTVDGEERSLNGVAIATGDDTRDAIDLSERAPLAFAVGERATICVPGPLSAGRHSVQITVLTHEVGPLTFPVADTIAET